SWSASDTQGITGINLTIGDMKVPLVPSLREWAINLDEGTHVIIIEVSDISGRTDNDSIILIVDLTPPMVERSAGPIVSGGSVFLEWSVNETEIDELEWSLTLDNETVPGVDYGKGRHELRDVPPGNHVAVLTATDPAGNSVEIVWDFNVKSQEPKGVSGSGLSPFIVILIIILFIAAVIAIAAFLVLRRRPKEEGKKVAGPARPEKLRLSHVAPLVAAGPARTTPPAQRPDVIEDGPSYIRPKRPAPMKRDAVRSGPVVRPSEAKIQRPARTIETEPKKASDEEVPVWDEDEVEWDEIPEWEDA
ncbi:MAG: hypothetical protein QCI82_01355, partial [Candidatus Thermoplasmatota archaeon]|nr:hypothetical protein [Candidatus Thermoplasmatota archaeon]